MDEAEKERLPDEGPPAGNQELRWKLERALLWGFFGAAIGGGLFISLLSLPEIAVLLPGAAAGWYGWHRKSKKWW
jgi:hypothetical protein